MIGFTIGLVVTLVIVVILGILSIINGWEGVSQKKSALTGRLYLFKLFHIFLRIKAIIILIIFF